MFRKKTKYISIIILNILFLCLILFAQKEEEEYVFLNIFLSQEGFVNANIKQMNNVMNFDSQTEQEPIFLINLQNEFSGNGNYFFLPKSADLSNVIINVLSDVKRDSKILFDDVELNIDENIKFGLLEEGLHCISVDEIETNFYICKGSDIPVVMIETTEGMEYIHMSKDNETTAEIKILDSNGNVEYKGNLEKFGGRGNSTWSGKKKSYGIKLEDKEQLLEMTPGKSWVLQGGGYDITTIRNQIFLDMAKECELENAIDSEWVDLYIDNKYYGCYLLTEKITIASGRLEIGNLEKETEKINDSPLIEYDSFFYDDELKQKGYLIPNNPTCIEGGYLLEVEIYPDRYYEEGSGFITKRGVSIVVKDPEYCSEEQIQYISTYVQEFEDALYSENGYNFQGKSFTEYIDMNSFATRYIIDEFSKNIDAGYSSYFMYKPSNESKLYAGPVWDYDTALGNNNGWGITEILKDPEGLYVNTSLWSSQLWLMDEFRVHLETIYQNSFQEYLNYLSEVEMYRYVFRIYDSLLMNSMYYQDENLDEEIAFLINYVEKREDYFEEMFLEELSK